jgi:hypothetical protein
MLTNIAVFATKGPNDSLTTDEQTRPLLPAGRWMLDLIMPPLERAGFGTLAASPTSSGYWILTIDGGGRRFDMLLSDIRPIFVCEIAEPRTLIEWLKRAPRDGRFGCAFRTVCEALRADPRIQGMRTFSGDRKERVTFAEGAIEELERELGIYSR